VLQRWLRRRLWRPEFQQALLPEVGTSVGGYHLEARLRAGGFGTVYRARRGGRLYALKFIYLPRTEAWGWRELEVLLRLRRVGTLPLEGHGKWPDTQPLFLFLAMEYVDGRPLYEWAEHKAPTARQVARLVLALAQQLVAVHSQGVVHRDVKGDNVLVRSADEVPVLVDFGVGTYPGAPSITGAALPGTASYRSPEALRFRRQRAQGERYEGSGLDDLWALGVVLYRLLTGRYPFDGDEAALEDGILFLEPAAPRERNPRVPEALGALCLRLLTKAPEARCPDAQALCAALEAVLREAEADAAWDVPLCQPSGKPAPSPLEAPPGTTRAAPPTSGEGAPRQWGVWAGAVLGLMALLAALALWPSRELEARHAPVTPPVPFGREMAPSWQASQGAGGAAPPWAATPAPVARATPSEDMPVKTHPTAPTPQKKKRRGATAKSVAVAACTALAGCTGGAQALRPLPPPEDCPREAVEAMDQLELTEWRYAYSASFNLDRMEDERIIPLNPGQPATMRVFEKMGKLEPIFFVTGKIFVGEGRLYARFTELRTGNNVYPVCLELTGPKRTQGAEDGLQLEPGSTPEVPRVFSKGNIRAVGRFE
jgi:serine/threonine-protein kinase